jgi:uncharacterized protein (DUF983 family)
MPTVVWQPARNLPRPAWPVPSLATALARGLACRCPACGEAPAFNGFLNVAPACAACGAPLGTARADDAPPYFTILIVGHLMVPLILLWQRAGSPPDWEVAAVLLPLTAALCLALLRPVKGAVLGVMIAMRMLASPDRPGE